MYDWPGLLRGLGTLRDAWARFQLRNPEPPAAVTAALRTLQSRVQAMTEDPVVAQQLDDMLHAVQREHDHASLVSSEEEEGHAAVGEQTSEPHTPDRAARTHQVSVLSSPEVRARIQEWQTLDLRTPSPSPERLGEGVMPEADPGSVIRTDSLEAAEHFDAENDMEPNASSFPWTPVEVSPRTERRFMEMSMGDPSANSPIRGDESPPHLLFKKWYRQETWVDPSLVHESDMEVYSNEESAGESSEQASGSCAASAHTSRPLSERLAAVVPRRPRIFKFGACPHHECARSPFVFGPGAAPERRGRPFVICNRWWKYDGNRRLCWHMVPASEEQWREFPLFQKQKWESLKYSLARGSRP